MYKSEIISLVDLLVNTDNYRFESVASQKEAINLMISDQGDKLFNLAQHIVQNGLNPNDRIQVVVSNHDDTKFNVVEGNRRTVALKILNNPDLIEDVKFQTLKRKFQKLNEENKESILKEVECTIYDNPNEADKWIKIKHGGQGEGVGTVSWEAKQLQRFEEKVEGKSSLALQILKILEKSQEVPKEVKTNLNDLKITNLDRLISDPAVRDFLGIEVHKGIIQSNVKEEEVLKGLIQIATDLIDSNFNVKKIYTKEDRKDYLDNFPNESKPNIEERSTKPWQAGGSNSSITSKETDRPKPNPKDRKYLIPKNCLLKISKPKVNNIYHELKSLDINIYTNAAAVLLRVFFELSIDTYLEENNMLDTPSAARSGLDFKQKALKVASHLEQKNSADQAICKTLKVSVKDSNNILGIDTWHAYVHNNRFSPIPQNLTLTWDGIQDFITILWQNIK